MSNPLTFENSVQIFFLRLSKSVGAVLCTLCVIWYFLAGVNLMLRSAILSENQRLYEERHAFFVEVREGLDDVGGLYTEDGTLIVYLHDVPVPPNELVPEGTFWYSESELTLVYAIEPEILTPEYRVFLLSSVLMVLLLTYSSFKAFGKEVKRLGSRDAPFFLLALMLVNACIGLFYGAVSDGLLIITFGGRWHSTMTLVGSILSAVFFVLSLFAVALLFIALSRDVFEAAKRSKMKE